MTTLYIIIWLTLIGFLLTLYLTFFTWYLWPVLMRKSHCAWCWKSLSLMRWYPQCWSSTICGRHDRQLRAQSAARRSRRIVAATSPSGEVQA